VLQLVEQGKISLDDGEFVKKIAPEISQKKVYADGITAADQQKDVTVRMLLSHTAGFAYSFLDPRVQVNEFTGEESAITSSPMVNQPGTMWEYGINLDWAGIILERVTGQKLGEYFQQHIFKPLGIESTTMFPTKEMKANFSQLHQRSPEGVLSETPLSHHPNLLPIKAESQEDRDKIFQAGGHGLFSKPKEYVKVLAALLNDGTSPTTGATILKPETVNSMFENQIPGQPDFARGGPPSPMPTVANSLPEMYPQEGNPPQGWGLSFFLTITPGGTGRGANTGWWAGLPNLFYWVDREKGVAGVIAGQVLPFGDAKVFGAWYQAEKALYDGLE
jgi:CubicO group peptidase (beta-lactamase class C family)